MALFICPECGNRVSSSADSCINCGYPVSDIIEENRKNEAIKRMAIIKKIVFIGVIIVLISIVTITIINYNKNKNLFYYSVEWGTDIDSASNQLNKYYDNCSQTDDSIFVSVDKYMDEDEYEAVISYRFEDGKLDTVNILISRSDNLTNVSGIYNKAIEKLTSIYGAPTEEQSYSQEWEKNKIEVSLFKYSNKLIMLTFSENK